MRIFRLKIRFQTLLFIISVICIRRTVDTADCTDEFSWPCDTGGQCIDKIDLCDGTPNCLDGSDETVKNCIQKISTCSRYSFRCTYGACIQNDLRCNGQNDCADGSDELPTQCKPEEWKKQLQANCPRFEYKCRSGECITQDNFCDGQADCADASDESLEFCASYFCPGVSFRCGYGACVNGDAACNGKAECFDASDESPVMCNTSTIVSRPPIKPVQTTRTPTTTTTATVQIKPNQPPITVTRSCQIPADKRFLIVEDALTGGFLSLGVSVPANRPLYFSCVAGYVLKGANNSVCKGGDEWTQNLPGCYHFCSDKHPRSGFSTKVTFDLNGDVSRKTLFEPGTIARINCEYFYERPTYFREKITCMDYGWNAPKLACNMKCGRPEDPLTQFSKGGENTNITEVPWHVGIYRKSDNNRFENICGGTLISPRVVVSAAHCFFEKQRTQFTKIDLTTFSIAAGKYYRQYDREESDMSVVERRNIIDVWIPDEYNGAESGFYRDISIIKLDKFIAFSDTIRPACLYLPEEADQYIPSGEKGRVSAWSQIGERGRESTLQTLHMETVSHGECDKTLSAKSFINIRGDKFCLASYGAEAFACKGDSGSGFVVRTKDGTFALYGVVSFSPTRTQECSRDNLLVMTNVLFYKNQLGDAKNEDLGNDIDFDSLQN